MVRRYLIHGLAAALIALAALLLIRLHNAKGASPGTDNASEGHRLAEAWCKTCHVIDMKTAGTANTAPDFAAIANQTSTTELSLKVFLRSSHRKMPNLILRPEQADNLVSYILSLKRK
jgi:mono/diheme cytochrome c family protein